MTLKKMNKFKLKIEIFAVSLIFCLSNTICLRDKWRSNEHNFFPFVNEQILEDFIL